MDQPLNRSDVSTQFSEEWKQRAIERAERRNNSNKSITKEWFLLSQLGYYYGWQAVKDVLNDYITLEQASLLLRGAEIIHSIHVNDNAVSNLAANAHKVADYRKLMKKYTNDIGAIPR